MSTLGDIFGAGGVAGFLGKVADKIWPDPLERAKQQVRLLELQQAGEFKEIDARLAEMSAQTDVNKEEAKHASVFVSGWRPAVGWMCVAACGWNWLGLPVVRVGMVLGGADDAALAHLQSADLSDMLPLLFGMLGLAGMRSWEKKHKVATK